MVGAWGVIAAELALLHGWALRVPPPAAVHAIERPFLTVALIMLLAALIDLAFIGGLITLWGAIVLRVCTIVIALTTLVA